MTNSCRGVETNRGEISGKNVTSRLNQIEGYLLRGVGARGLEIDYDRGVRAKRLAAVVGDFRRDSA